VRQRIEAKPGSFGQSKQAEDAVGIKSRAPSCRWCERLDETIISLLSKFGVRTGHLRLARFGLIDRRIDRHVEPNRGTFSPWPLSLVDRADNLLLNVDE